MPSSNLAAYLAKNYLNASTAPSHPDGPPKKKRKKSKHLPAVGGLLIADDDEELGLSTVHTGGDDDGNTEAPTLFEGKARSAEFRRAKKSTWRSLSGPEPTSTSITTGNGSKNNDNYADDQKRSKENDDDDADRLLRAAQSDETRRLAEQEAENAPAVVEIDIDASITPSVMSNGLRAGLQSAADTARLVAAQEKAEAEAEALSRHKKSSRKHKKGKDGDDREEEVQEEETIYRDATGRRIDVSLRRAEARREEAERARAKQQERIDAMGEVQRVEREQRRQELDEAKFMTLGRTVEDDEYNNRLKGVVRWDDPMAAYMAEKEREAQQEDDNDTDEVIDDDETNGSKAVVKTKKKKNVTNKQRQQQRRKEYQGPTPPPNRYGIKPGWRWDGVDRGNGFEKDWFQARSRRSRNDQLSYEWQMDE